MSDSSREIQELIREMKEKNGKIIAHPFMYVSGLHNKFSCYPVDQNDPFFIENGIEFLEVPDEDEGKNTAPDPLYKYVVKMDEAGAFRHTMVKVDDV